MTSNQIANAANVETNRHNMVTEEIAIKSNDIQEQRNQFEREYHSKLNAIQEEYNRRYLEMQEAQGQRKLDLQQELNWIEWKKSNVDEEYKSNLINIQSQEASTHAKAQAESERYQKRLNELGFDQNAINAQLANIKEKQAEYEKYSIEQQVRIQDFNALVNKMKADNEYSLGLMRVENEQVRNELQKELQEYQKANIILSNVWDGVGTLLGPFGAKLFK